MLRSILPATALLFAAPLLAQAATDDPAKGFCALNTKSALCEAALAGKQAKGGLDLGAELAKGEAWAGTPATRGERMTCLATWTAIGEKLGSDDRWPKSVTPAVAKAQVERWETFVKAAFVGLEDREPAKRAEEMAEARENIGNARVADLAQWAGFCKRDPE